MKDLIGKDVGRYHITDELGEGGMATVYKAFDSRLEREVAIKIIRPTAFPPDQLEPILKRFEREAKALAKLSHPNIVKVYDYGEYEGSPYLVLEYLPSGTLKQRLTELNGEPMPWKEAIHLLSPIAEALEFAHSQGLVHRDVKPSNILITNTGQTMLSDFGIAKLFGADDVASLTSSGIGMGTPEYMAPEQWTGKASPQSDQYSLGVILYEMVTGRTPYKADTPAAILLKQATEPLPQPKTFSPDLPGGLDDVLVKALSTKPEDRFPDMQAFSQALRNLDENKKAKRNVPKKKGETHPKVEDELTIDHYPAKADTSMGRNRKVDQSSKKGKPRQESAPSPQKPKRSRSWIWISLASLLGIILVASAGYWFFFLNHANKPPIPSLPKSTATMIAATTAPAPAILPSPTMEATAIPPTDTPESIPIVSPMPTQKPINRTVITTENGKYLAELSHFTVGTIDQIKWTVSNRFLLVYSPFKLHLYDASDFTEITSFPTPVREVYFSDDGSLVAFFATTTSLQVQNVADKTILVTLPIPPHNGSITSIVFSPDNSEIAVGTSTGTITIWRLSDKSKVSTMDAPNTYVSTMTFSLPNGEELASGSGSSRSTDYSLRIWNVAQGKLQHTVNPHNSPITYLFYYPDGNIMASGSKDDGMIYIWDLRSEPRAQNTIKAFSATYKKGMESMAFSRDGSLLAYSIAYPSGHAILLTLASDGTIIKINKDLPNEITNLAFSVDNTALASADNATVTIWGIP